MTRIAYDSRAVTFDGKRALLLCGSIHYPRSTPAMWPALMARSREAGLNAIDTYVFWNLHERRRGVFDFSGRLDLLHFCRLAQEHGLSVVMRVGPYICAETNYGGFPAWLRDVPDMRMRTWNQPFMREMERWLRFLCDYLKPMFAPNGGPIVLAQLENEFSNIAKNYGAEGPGDRILATPMAFGPHTIFGRMPGFSRPERGDIIVAEPNYARRMGFWMNLYDSFARFVTFQLISPARSGLDGRLSAPTLLRVVGVPGDTLVMDDFIFKVKASGAEQFLTEFELSSSRYDVSHEDAPDSWSADLPGSGHMDERVLGKDEYFLAGDARTSSSDSRLWGPVHIDRFHAKALLRYWPPKRFGAP